MGTRTRTTALLAAVALTVGCSPAAEPATPSPSGDPTTTAITTPPPEPALVESDQAEQAFEAIELLDPWTVRAECPGEDWCDASPATTRLYLGVEQRLVGEWRLTSAQLLLFDSADAAQTWSAGAGDDSRERYGGDYAVATVVHEDGSFNPGQIGAGAVETIGDGPWSGTLTTRQYRYADLDDEPYGEQYLDESRLLQACNAVLIVDVTAERAIFDDVSSSAEQLWDPLLDEISDALPEVCA